MRLITFRFLFLFLAFVCSACGWSDHVLNPEGDTATIKTAEGATFTGEIIVIQDSTLYLLGSFESSNLSSKSNKRIYILPFIKVTSIEINGYSDRSWETSVISFQAIPSILFFIAASSAGIDSPGSAFLIFGIPTALTYLLFEVSTPSPPEFTSPLATDNIKDLRKYTRYPQGMNTDQLETFLAQNK